MEKVKNDEGKLYTTKMFSYLIFILFSITMLRVCLVLFLSPDFRLFGDSHEPTQKHESLRSQGRQFRNRHQPAGQQNSLKSEGCR